MKINNKLFWIFVLSSAVYFTQGIEGLPGLSLFFYLKEKLHLSPSTIMYLSTITGIAWLIKPIQGFLCDNYLSKKTWIILSLLGSILISFYLGLIGFLPLIILMTLMALGSFNATIRDVANDGIMCVEGKEVGECGSIQAIQWTSITFAGIITGLVGGYIADHYSYKVGYLTLIPIYLIIMGIVLKYKSSNKPKESCETCNYQYCCDFSDNKWCQSYERIKPKLLEQILSYKELFTNKPFLFACLFIFLYNFAPGFGTPLMFIERDSFHWSGTFMGVLGAITSIVSIGGSILYFKFGKKLDVKKCLLYSVFIGAITTLCYLWFNPYSAIIYNIIFSFIGMIIFLNIMAWMANSTLPGKEATSFALLCSINNLSGTCSTLVGAWLYPLIGLKFLIIISAFTSFLCLPLISKLEIK
jgi:MFS family permease